MNLRNRTLRLLILWAFCLCWAVPSRILGQALITGNAKVIGNATLTYSNVINNSVVYDTVGYQYLGSPVTAANTTTVTVGSGLVNQGMALLYYTNDTGTSDYVPGSAIAINSSGLVPLNFQKVGSTNTGAGNTYSGCLVGTGGGTYSGSTQVFYQLSGSGPTGWAANHLTSFGYVNQGSITSASGGTCEGVSGDTQTLSLAASNDIAPFGEVDTSNNETATCSGFTCTSRTTGFTQIGQTEYTATGASGSHTLTWGARGTTSAVAAFDVQHDNGSSAPTCAFEAYNRFDSGSSGTNVVGNESTTLTASSHGNQPGQWGGGTNSAGTLDLDSTHTTTLYNDTSEMCGDLTIYNNSTAGQGLEMTVTTSATSNYERNHLPSGVNTIQNGSHGFMLCSDVTTTSMPSGSLDLANIYLANNTFAALLFVSNGTNVEMVVEAGVTGNTFVANYPTGGSCTSGGTGWVHVELDTPNSGTGCSGGPCATEIVKNYVGTQLGSTSIENNAFTGTNGAFTWTLGTISAEKSNGSTFHVWYAQDMVNFQGTSPIDQ